MDQDRRNIGDAVAQTDTPPPRLRWVPIRALASLHRPRMLEHLLALSATDRYLRFGHAATDAQIERYIDSIDFDRDEVFGVFSRRLELQAMAHLAYLAPSEEQPRSAEFGVSVAEDVRGRGFGARLFDHAMLQARNHHVDTLIVQALSENTAMLRIARQAGAQIERHGTESEAVVKLPPQDMTSKVEAAWREGMAEIDYGWKRQNHRVQSWLDALARPRAHTEQGDAGAG